MTSTDDKRNGWAKAINQVVSGKYSHIVDVVVDYLVYLEENYNAGIHFKITNVPDVRFLTGLGKQRHFLVIRKSYEMHFYLNNPARTLKSYPFIRDKGSPKNHHQVIGGDVPKLSSTDLNRLIYDSFCYIAGIPNASEDQFNAYAKKSFEDSGFYQPTRADVEKVFNEMKTGNADVSLGQVLNRMEEDFRAKELNMADDWKDTIRKDIEKWFSKAG